MTRNQTMTPGLLFRGAGWPTSTVVATAVAVGLSFPALAQSQEAASTAAPTASPAATNTATNDDTGVQEVVVTATRQSQTAQRVPISLTAVGAAQLAKEGITSVTQLGQLSPSLYMQTAVSEGSARYTIRGLTVTDTLPTASPAVATYIDDVYQAFQYGINSALFDIQRIEILRGPQGTTFGKNTTGGAVAYFSQTPTNVAEGYVSGQIAGGDQARRFLEAAINVPIIDNTLAMRISARTDSKGTWVYDVANGIQRGGGNGQNGRFQLRWTPSAGTAVNLTAFATSWRGDTPQGHGVIVPEEVDPRLVAQSPANLFDNFDNNGVTLRVEQNFGSFNLTSISHYRRSRYNTSQDSDGRADDFIPFLYISDARANQYGQELRLASDPALRLSGVGGLYFEHDRIEETTNEATITSLNNYNNLQRTATTTTTYATFANLTFRVTDQLSVIGGLRKSSETRQTEASKLYFDSGQYAWNQGNLVFNTPPAVPDQTLAYGLKLPAKPWTWDGTIDYNPDRSLLIYARVARGFRSGGFNPPVTIIPAFGTFPATVQPPYQGETLQSYEGGIKLDLLANMLRINASVYHYDYSNQQVQVLSNFIAITSNAGKSKVDGGELEITANPAVHWELRGSVAYTKARYVTYVESDTQDNSGNPLVQAPTWTANGSIAYTTPVSANYNLRASTTWSYRTRVYFDPHKDINDSDGAYANGAVRIGIEPSGTKGFSVTAFGNEIKNQRRLAGAAAFVPGAYYVKYFQPGASYGLDVTYRW
jgi:iron complex outermembrane recepter protein